MSDGAWIDRSDGVAHLKNGGLGLCASGEPGGEVQLRNGEAAFAAIAETDVKAQLMSDGPWLCAFDEAFLMMSRELGPVAFVGASLRTNGGPVIGAADGASQRRNDVLGLGGVSLLMNGGVGVSCLDDFGRFPLYTDLAGQGGVADGVMADVVEVLNETSVCGGGPGGPVAAAVLVASYKGGGYVDGRSLERGAEVKTGVVVGEEEVNGLFVVLAEQALIGDSGKSAASLDMLDAPRKFDAPHRLFAPGRLEAL